MHKMIVAVIKRELLEEITSEMRKEGVHFSFSEVRGFGKEVHLYHDDIHDRLKIEVIAEERDVEKVKKIVMESVQRGIQGTGIIAVYTIDEFIDLSEKQ
jgi:nitrogen regulatory protein PII